VREWVGFPAGFQLQATSESITNAARDSLAAWGKPVWGYTYENRNRSLVRLEIAVFQSGTLWGTNRTMMPKEVEKQIARMRSLGLPDGDEFFRLYQVAPLPNGDAAYFTVMGFGPGGTGLGGFAYERDYDLLVMEDISADYDEPERRMKNPISPTNDLPVLFRQVAAFLDAQANGRGNRTTDERR
jgi:hypothetical protein